METGYHPCAARLRSSSIKGKPRAPSSPPEQISMPNQKRPTTCSFSSGSRYRYRTRTPPGLTNWPPDAAYPAAAANWSGLQAPLPPGIRPPRKTPRPEQGASSKPHHGSHSSGRFSADCSGRPRLWLSLIWRHWPLIHPVCLIQFPARNNAPVIHHSARWVVLPPTPAVRS